MTRFMEVFQIERIIPGLVPVSPEILSRPHLELDWNNRSAAYDDRIDSAPQARHIELEIELAEPVTQYSLEELNLRQPCISLLTLDRTGGSRGERSKD